jgi:chemotaxis signal transduction protein
MSVSDAWLLEPNDSLSIAIGDHEMVEYVQVPVSFPVPGSPGYCHHVLFWQDNLVPVMDIGVLLGQPAQDTSSFMSLIAYQQQPGSPLQYVAVKVRTAPEKIQVDDAQVSELSKEISDGILMPVCLSCFSYGNRPVVILDIARLCSAEFRDLVNSPQNLGTGFSESVAIDPVQDVSIK